MKQSPATSKLMMPQEETPVVVELIEIPFRDWPDMDRLEGYPRLYHRELPDFALPDGTTVQAWIYIRYVNPSATVESDGNRLLFIGGW